MSSIFRMVKRKVALAFADTSGHGNSDDNKMTARRSRRGNIQKRSDPSDVTDSDSDDDIDFLDEMQMVKSCAGTSMKAERSQRQQQRHEAKTQNRQDDKQSHADDLRQREEEELRRAIELSKLDMVVEKSGSDSEDESITGDESTPEHQQDFNKKQTLQLTRKSLSSKGSRAADGPSKRHGLHEDKPSSISGNSTPNEVEPTSQEHFNEWQDEMESTDWEDPCQEQGVNNSDGSSPSFCMKRTDSVERRGKINNSQAETGRHQYAEEICQPTEKSPLELRSRLRLRKRPVQEEGSSQPGQPFKTKKVPPPPDVDESDDEDGDEQSLEEIDMTKDEEGLSREEEDTPEETEEGRQDLEIIKLVDTRKPRHSKHPYYAPLNSSKRAYTKVVYKLIQAYCSRLRRAQTKALTRVCWGHQVMTGNCFSDTLVFRKRGSKGLAFYTLSDSDEEEIAELFADNQEKEGTTSNTSVKTQLERGKKKMNFLDDDDSDFDDYIPVKRNKMSTKGRQKLSAPDVLEMVKMKSQHLQELEEDLIVPDDEETLSQTLVQDQSQTQDYSPVQKEASEYDSDRSQPTIRTAPKSQLNPSADSQNSITDIFKVSTNYDETDEHQASESPSKNTDGRKHRRASTQGSEEDDNVDSFDERLMSLSSLNTSSGPPKAVTPTVKNNSQSSNHATSQELLSTNHSKFRNFKQEDHEKNEFSDKSVISSVPADSSQHCEPSQENLRTESRDREFKDELYDAHGPSFEEKRFIYFGEMLASSEPDKMEKSSREEMPEDGGDDGVSEEGKEISQSEVNKNMQIATPEKLLRGQRSRQQKRLSRATNSGGSLPPEGQQLPTNNLSAFRPHRASIESTKQKVGRSKTECFIVDEQREEDSDGEQTERDCSDEEGVQDKDGVEAGEEEVEDGGDDDSDSDVTCMDEQEIIGDDISEPPQDGDQIDGDQTEGHREELHEDRDEEGFIAGGDDITVEDDVEEIGVECPLCGVQFPLDRIEAHASGCNGPVSPEPPPKENNRQEDDVDSEEVPVRGRRAQHHPVRKGLVSSLNGDDAPGPSTAAEPKRRSQVRNTEEGGRPVRGIATKILKEKSSGSISSKQEFISSSRSPNDRRSTPIFDEDSSESFSESNDHLNATLFQLVEDKNLFQRKRTRVQERPAKRQRLQDQNKHEETPSSVEDTEPCFICNKRIPKSLYAQHVQDEIDRDEKARLSQDAVQPRRGLRSKKAIAKAAGGETSTDTKKFQSGPSNDVGDLIEDCPSGEWEQDSESDGSSFASDDPILDPMVSESPIKAFRPISKQPMNFINFKNQFQNNVSGSRKRHRSTTSSNRGRGQGSRGGGRKQRGKKRRRIPRKK